MSKYKNINCPICNEPLDNGKEISVCPDCGAPYHKECILKIGECVYDDLHKQGKEWKSPQQEFEEHAQNMEEKRCGRCGTINDSSRIFCEVCGNSLNQNTTENNQNNNYNTESQNFNFIDDDIFNNPFGGVSPDEKIDDIPAKDWVMFVRNNTGYFIRQFKKMEQGKKFTLFNLSSAVFGGIYYIYRKMYLYGIILLIMQLILAIPSIIIRAIALTKYIYPDMKIFTWLTNETIQNAVNVSSTINLFLMIAVGIFTNRIYKYHCKNKILKLRKNDIPHEEYVENLRKKGGVSEKLIIVLLVFNLLYFVATTLLLFYAK